MNKKPHEELIRREVALLNRTLRKQFAARRRVEIAAVWTSPEGLAFSWRHLNRKAREAVGAAAQRINGSDLAPMFHDMRDALWFARELNKQPEFGGVAADEITAASFPTREGLNQFADAIHAHEAWTPIQKKLAKANKTLRRKFGARTRVVCLPDYSDGKYHVVDWSALNRKARDAVRYEAGMVLGEQCGTRAVFNSLEEVSCFLEDLGCLLA